MMDWADIAIHCGLAAVLTAAAAFAGWHWPMAGAVSAAFIGREAWQARQKYDDWFLPWRWSAQKLLEALAPAIVAIAVATGSIFVR